MTRNQNGSPTSIKCILLVLSFFASTTFAAPPKLSAPSYSDDGTFILRLTERELESKNIEIYRNKNGGEYTKIADIPRFSSLSQIIYENGTYGYKVRSKKQGKKSSFSDPVYIQVHSTLPKIMKKKQRRQLSTANL